MIQEAPTTTPAPAEERPFGERLRARESGALDEFFDTWFDRVHGYVRRMVSDEHTAEDLTQDVFMHAYRALPSYDPKRDPRPWLFTIASNKVRDHWRSQRGRASNPDASLEQASIELPPAGVETPTAKIEHAELSAEVRAAIARLPDGLRETVSMRVYDGLSFEAVGRILDRSVVAIRKRYSRGLVVLREIMEGTWHTHVAEGV